MDAAVSQFGLMFFNARFLAIRMMVEADLRGWLLVMVRNLYNLFKKADPI
jgi:hypothetical protein